MHIRRSPSGDGPTIYRPNESAAMRLDPPPRPVANEPDSIPPPPRDSLLMRVNRRRSQILTVMVSIAAIASFGSVVWWAHNQDVKSGGRGLQDSNAAATRGAGRDGGQRADTATARRHDAGYGLNARDHGRQAGN